MNIEFSNYSLKFKWRDMELQLKNRQFDISVSTFCIVFRAVHQYKTVMHSIEIMVYTSQTLVRLDQAQFTLQKLE